MTDIWQLAAGLLMIAGGAPLAWMMLLDEVRWHRRVRDLEAQIAKSMKPAPAPFKTLAEYIAAAPHWAFYFGPNWMNMSGHRTLRISIGKDWTAREGDMLYRLNIEARMVEPPAGVRTVIIGPFVDSAAWTGAEPIHPGCRAYVLWPARRLRLYWSFRR